MGRINEYQRRQLASVVVGTPSPSRGGEIIGKAMYNLGNSMISMDAKLQKEEQQKQDIYTDIQANSDLMKWNMGFNEMSFALQNETSSDPASLPNKLALKGTEMINTYAASIQNQEVKTKFLKSSTLALKNATLNSYKWVDEKQKENATIAFNDSIEMNVLKASDTNSPEDLANNMYSLHGLIYQMPGKLVSSQEKQKIWDSASERSLKANLVSRAGKDPEGTIADIKEGKYANVKIYNPSGLSSTKEGSRQDRLPFTPELKQMALNIADKAIKAKAKEQRTIELKTKTENSVRFDQDVLDGKLNVAEIYVEASKGVIDPNEATSAIEHTTLKKEEGNEFSISDADAIKQVANSIPKLDKNEVMEIFMNSKMSFKNKAYMRKMINMHFGRNDSKWDAFARGWGRAMNIFNSVNSSKKDQSEMTMDLAMLSTITEVPPQSYPDMAKSILQKQIVKNDPSIRDISDKGQLRRSRSTGKMVRVFNDGRIQDASITK